MPSTQSDTDMLVRWRDGSAHKQAALWIDRYEAINLRGR
jgi:hypothetical protein